MSFLCSFWSALTDSCFFLGRGSATAHPLRSSSFCPLSPSETRAGGLMATIVMLGGCSSSIQCLWPRRLSYLGVLRWLGAVDGTGHLIRTGKVSVVLLTFHRHSYRHSTKRELRLSYLPAPPSESPRHPDGWAHGLHRHVWWTLCNWRHTGASDCPA